MKKLFILFAAFLLSTPVFAVENGFFYNPDRVGEGMAVSIDGDLLSFVLFTFVDGHYSSPPRVSPSPPESDFESRSCANSQTWFSGSGIWLDNLAIGNIYLTEADDYPQVMFGKIGKRVQIGQFLIEPNGDGYDLSVQTNNVLPAGIHMFGNTFTFIKYGLTE